MSDPESGAWWRDVTLPLNQTLCLELGPLRLFVRRLPGEWQTFFTRDSSALLSNHVALHVPFEGEVPEDSPELQRFATQREDTRCRVMPLLADRPVVVRPEKPFVLLPGDTATMYLSTIAWVRVELGDTHTVSLEIPVFRPSDTWFGANTIEGELCYESFTLARLRIEDLTTLPSRIHSAIVIHNRASDALSLERIKLPAVHLALLANTDHVLWTPGLTVERSKAGVISVAIDKTPPVEAGETTTLGAARKPEFSRMPRALQGLFA